MEIFDNTMNKKKVRKRANTDVLQNYDTIRSLKQ